MNHFLVDYDAPDKLGICETLPLLLDELNVVDIGGESVASLFNDVIDRVNGNFSKMFCRACDAFACHGSHRNLLQSLPVLQVDRLSYLIQNLTGLFSGLLIARIYDRGMKSHVEQELGFLEKLACKDHRGGCSVAHFVVLSLGNLH